MITTDKRDHYAVLGVKKTALGRLQRHRRAEDSILRCQLAFFVLALASIYPADLRSQSYKPSDSISLGSATLTLGTTEPEAVKHLSADFDLRDHSKTGAISAWEVCRKGSTEPGPCLGRVTFDHGKLVEAIRRWPQVGTTAEFAKLLNTVAARFVAEGHTSCRLDVVQLRDQISTDDSTLIIC